MATTGTGFDVPIALNLQRKQDKLEEKHRLSDEELQGQIGELVDNRKAIQAKLPTLLDDKGQPTPEYNSAMQSLTSNAQALRKIYHPNTNPSAVARYGHLLTDMLHLTSPADRQQKEAAKQDAAHQGDVRTAQSEAAAAPTAPKTPAQLWQAYQDTYKKITGKEVPPEVAEQIARTGKAAEPKDTPEKFFPQLQTTEETLPDGTKKIHYWRVPMSSGDKPEEVDFNGQTMVPKLHPSTSAEAQWIRATYGKDLEALSPEQAQEAVSRFRQLNTPSTTSTGQSLVYDQNNQPHVFTHTGTTSKTFPSAKGSSSTPIAPASASTTAPPNGATGAKKTPAELRKEADKLNSRSSSTSKSPRSPIGPALDFKKMTPEITAANKKYDDAVGLTKFADKVQKNPSNPQEQRQFAMAMARTMANRFQMQEYDLEVKNSGVANTFQQWLNNFTTGALPPNIINNLVKSAHDYKDAMAAEVEAAKGTTETPSATPTNGKSLADRLNDALGGP